MLGYVNLIAVGVGNRDAVESRMHSVLLAKLEVGFNVVVVTRNELTIHIGVSGEEVRLQYLSVFAVDVLGLEVLLKQGFHCSGVCSLGNLNSCRSQLLLHCIRVVEPLSLL